MRFHVSRFSSFDTTLLLFFHATTFNIGRSLQVNRRNTILPHKLDCPSHHCFGHHTTTNNNKSRRSLTFTSKIGGSIRHSSSRRFLQSSMKNIEPAASEDDMKRWDSLYLEGEARRGEVAKKVAGATDTFSDSVFDSSQGRSEVRVVSFDLDNTLWKTGPTISAANDALASFLEEKKIKQPIRIENVMKDLFHQSKRTYCPQLSEEDALSDDSIAPVCLTLLRKDAIQYTLEQHNNYTTDDAMHFADDAFSIWTDARHEATQSNLASNVVACLEKISSSLPAFEDGSPVVIGAITDGNSDPRKIAALKPYFDFVINAEEVGVSKPDTKVYAAAVRQVLTSFPSLRQSILGDDGSANLNSDSLAEAVGPWWVHVGDDFIKDIVASKSMNMRTIWCKELIVDKKRKKEKDEAQAKKKEERSVEDFVKDISEQQSIKMSVGADDYLANAIEKEFADTVTDHFPDVGDILITWHNEALDVLRYNQKRKASSPLPANVVPSGGEKEEEPAAVVPSGGEKEEEKQLDAELLIKSKKIEDALEVFLPDGNKKSKANKKNTIFCMYCGDKIPIISKFCSSCGKQLPIINDVNSLK